MAFPLPFVYGSPPDDAGLDLHGYLYYPTGTGPWPGVVLFHSPAFGADGMGKPELDAQIDSIARDLATAGFLAMFAEVRWVKSRLPGQTTDGRYPQQYNDGKQAVAYLRQRTECTGFVASFGGSGGGSIAAMCLLDVGTGFLTGVKSDAAVCLSAMLDAGDRDADVLVGGFVGKVLEYYFPVTDTVVLTSTSPTGKVLAGQGPIYFANGGQPGYPVENQPYSQATHFLAALVAAGVPTSKYLFHKNVTFRHSFGTWFSSDGENNKDPAILFLNNAVANWTGGGGTPGKPEPKGLFSLQAGPDGQIGDLSSKTLWNNPSIVGARIRTRWKVMQPTSAAVYDWSQIDAVLAICATKGKKIGLSIAAGCGTPAWVYSTAPTCTEWAIPIADQTVDRAGTMPLPWQNGFKTKWQTFINAMGVKYDANPNVSYVILTGFMQLFGMQMVQTDNGLTLLTTQATTDGFASLTAAYVPAAEAIIGYFNTAFPTTKLLLTIDTPYPGTAGNTDRETIKAYGEALVPINHIGRIFTNLKATLPPHDPPTSIPTYPDGKQPIVRSDDVTAPMYFPSNPIPFPAPPQPLRDMLLHGWSTGSKFLEPYGGDVENQDAAVQAVFAEVNALLVVGAPPAPVKPVITSPLVASGTVGEFFTYTITGSNDPVFYAADGASAYGLSVDVNTGVVSGILTGALGDHNITIYAINDAGQGYATLVLTILSGFVTLVRTPILFYPIGGRPPAAKKKPKAPGNLNVFVNGVAGDTTAQASWTAPTDTGNAPLTGYNARLSPGPGSISISGGGAALTADIQGLSLDTDQTFFLSASNDYGTSAEVSFDFRTNPAVVIPPSTVEPRGIYRLLNIGATGLPIWSVAGAPFWSKAYIDGSRYQARWDKIEPVAPVGNVPTYDWTDLDGYLALCATYGKKAIISMAAGIYNPQWLKDIAGPNRLFTEAGPEAGTLLVPWDSLELNYFFRLIKAMGVRYNANTDISAIICTGFGQTVDSVLAANVADTFNLTALAENAGYATAADGWLSAAQRCLTTFNSAFFRSIFIITQPQLPVPIGTYLKDGNQALIDYDTYRAGRFGQRNGYLTKDFTAATTNLVSKPFDMVYQISGAGRSAGYRFISASDNPLLDPTQTGTYVPSTGFSNALVNAAAKKAKFVEIFASDADNVTSAYTTAMTAARTSMLLNP